MFRQVQKRPSVTAYQRGCERNLPEGRLATNIATWNVRTLNEKTNFKLKNLLKEVDRFKIDILGVFETHCTDQVDKAFELDGYVIIHSLRPDGIHKQGVAFIMTKETSQHLQGYHLSYQPTEDDDPATNS